MNDYRRKPGSIRGLIEADRVHRDAYLDTGVFALEQERLFARSWMFVGHASQVPEAGDYVTTEIAARPLILVRQTDGTLAVLHNRCAHKGAMVVSQTAGSAGRAFRCPYHSWSYRLDGSLLAVPMRAGYEGTRMRECETGNGLQRVASAVHRGFVFARMSETGRTFEDHFGAALSCLDAMADRSPEGELEVAGQPLRNVIRCNWKIYLENVNDTLHANVTHESAALAAQAVWADQPPDTPKPMAMDQLLPFGSGDDFMARMGGRVFPRGHSILGINLSLHSAYSGLPEYEAAMASAYGPARAREILSWAPQNAILYPTIALKASPQTLRVIRALAPDRTLIETWAFRPRGAPQALVERTFLYNRLVFSPMSIVAHDDVHVFETIQRALGAPGNEWVSLHREYRPGELEPGDVTTTGTNELLMRNQFHAWADMMTAGAPAGTAQ